MISWRDGPGRGWWLGVCLFWSPCGKILRLQEHGWRSPKVPAGSASLNAGSLDRGESLPETCRFRVGEPRCPPPGRVPGGGQTGRTPGSGEGALRASPRAPRPLGKDLAHPRRPPISASLPRPPGAPVTRAPARAAALGDGPPRARPAR